MTKVLIPIDLAYNELRNFRVQSLASDPSSAPGGNEARVYYNSTAKELRYHDGTEWAPLGGGVTADDIDSSSAIITVTDNGDGSVTLGINNSQFDTRVRTSRLDQMSAPTANVNMNSRKLTGLAVPTVASDATNKSYVDGVASDLQSEIDAAIEGLDAKQSVRAATTGNINLSSAGSFDGVSLSVGDRVLVKNQSTASQNGIYVLTSGTPAFVRTDDMNEPGEFSGAFVFVEEGVANANTGWVCTTNEPITVGTTAINWAKFSSQGEILAGSGLSKTGNTLAVDTTVVRTTGNQTLGGTKTFSVIPALPASNPTTVNQATRKAYVDAISYITAGTALTKSGSTLSVTPGGIGTTELANESVTEDKLHPDLLQALLLDPSAHSVVVGNGSATSFVITHNLDTKSVIAQVWRNSSPFDWVVADIETTSLNTVTVRFSDAPTANEFLVVIVSAGAAGVGSAGFGDWNTPSYGSTIFPGTPTLQWRRAPGDRIEFRGRVQVDETVLFEPRTIFTLPSGDRPSAQRALGAWQVGSGSFRLATFNTNGTITLANTTGEYVLSFDGASISL